MPVISVVIPAYNCADFLGEAISSVLNQSFQDFEIIVVNDGSTDNTASVLETFHDRIRIINQSNKGKSEARNTGIEASSGDFVAFMDADDISHPDRFSSQVDFLRQNPDIGVVGSDVAIVDNRQQIKGFYRMPTSDLAIRWRSLFMLPCYNIMVRRDLLNKNMHIRFPSGIPYAEDYDFLVELLHYAKAASIPKPLLNYRLHGGNETSNREVSSRIFLHSKAVKKSLGYELSRADLDERDLEDLSFIMVEGVRKFPYSAKVRFKITNLYLDLWDCFSEKYKHNTECSTLQRQVLLRAVVIGFIPPLSLNRKELYKRFLTYDKNFLLRLVMNIPQVLLNLWNNYRIAHL